MKQYNIERFDVLLIGDQRVPAIYIKPDLDFMNFIKENNYTLITVLNGTGLDYDNKKIIGVVNQSSYYPNCRPNFFAENGLYIITLNSCWLGYPKPDKLGNVTFYTLG